MASELINIRIYDHAGEIEGTLSLTISIYNTVDSVAEIVGAGMIYDSVIKRYQYEFTNFDPAKEYVCDIDCSPSAIIRYLSCGIGDKNEGERIWNHTDKPFILNLNDRLAKIL